MLAGELGAQVGDEVITARAGEAVVKPRQLGHTLWSPGVEDARVLELIVPGGFERFFDESAHAAPTTGSERGHTLWENAELWGRYGIEMDPSSVPLLVVSHGLLAL